jgi:hypothetical protein
MTVRIAAVVGVEGEAVVEVEVVVAEAPKTAALIAYCPAGMSWE